jgi:ribonuclease HII
VSDGTNIKDSKQLSPEEREAIYQEIVDNPHIYDYTIAQRSNEQIDATNNILTSTMECFQESIQELANDFLLCTNNKNDKFDYDDEYDDEFDNDDTASSCSCYSIVDGQKAPKIKLTGGGEGEEGGGGVMPCRPFVKADSQVLTVALASIIAKVTRDRMVPKWHEQYPQYGFNVHKGYATREHIEAIHRYGPCPLHRMTFKSLKGR